MAIATEQPRNQLQVLVAGIKVLKGCHESPLNLVLFEKDPELVQVAFRAGVSSFIVDCENHCKKERQANYDTEINQDRPEDLRGITQMDGATAVCRIDRFGSGIRHQIERAIDHGADIILLPMVTSCDEVERFLGYTAGRCRAGILIETESACEIADQLARFPLDLIYVGLNDLMISRRATNLFTPLVDGTLDRIRQVFEHTPLGFGGLTRIDAGSPLPSLMLLQEMARMRCQFTFLRRSFKRDVAPDQMASVIAQIHDRWRSLLQRSDEEARRDHEHCRSRILAMESR